MSMQGSHNLRGGKGAPSRRPASIHETVTYPRINPITAEDDSCLNPSIASEHLLACGHHINTVKPNEPCAPNCHHIQNSKSDKKKEHATALDEKEFYCDACVDGMNETNIPGYASSNQAENMRGMMSRTEAIRRQKDTKYRKCYIAFKVTSIPIHSDGSLPSRYVPRAVHHPFDTALPQIGNNMFEDIEVDPLKSSVQKKKEDKTQDKSESSTGEIAEEESSSAENTLSTNKTVPVTSAEPTRRKLRSHTRPTLPAQPKGNTQQLQTVTRAARNSPSVVIPSAQHKTSSRAANTPPQPAPKRKRSATEASVNTSDKENEAVAAPPAKRAKATPSPPAADKKKATPRRSMRLSSKNV